jgi:hypothetical protein
MAGFRLRRVEHSERSADRTVIKPTTAVGWDRWMVAGLEAEDVAELVDAAAVPLC